MFKTKEERKIIKLAKEKARKEYFESIAREKAKKNFLESPDDFNFYKELLKGIDANPQLKIIVEKANGTKIILKLSEEDKIKDSQSDWIDFNSITTSNNEARFK